MYELLCVSYNCCVSLRRAVLHPNLVLTADDERALSPAGDGKVDVNELIKQFVQDESSSSGSPNTFAENALVNIAHDDAMECPICFDVIDSPMVVPNCMHQLYVLLLSPDVIHMELTHFEAAKTAFSFTWPHAKKRGTN